MLLPFSPTTQNNPPVFSQHGQKLSDNAEVQITKADKSNDSDCPLFLFLFQIAIPVYEQSSEIALPKKSEWQMKIQSPSARTAMTAAQW